MQSFFKIICFILLFFIFTSCSSKDKIKTADEYFQTAMDALTDPEDEDLFESIKNFEALEENYPFNNYSKHANLELIYLYFQQENFELSEQTAYKFLNIYSDYQNKDYIYLMIAKNLIQKNRGFLYKAIDDYHVRDLENMKIAADYFLRLINEYPNSLYVKDAQQNYVYIQNLIANNILAISEFYLDKKDYVSAIARGREILKEYPQSSAKKSAIAIIIKASDLLNIKSNSAFYLEQNTLN